MLVVACSVWGEPGRLERWRATLNGLEGVALAHNDNLLCLDELRELDPREAGGVAYMLANGAGKRRGQPYGGVRPRLTWRLLFLSSGEMSLEHHMADIGKRTYAGQDVRLADVPADAGQGMGLFEELHGMARPQQCADTLRRAVHEHYGHAGRAFLTALVGDLAGNLATLTTVRTAFVETQVPAGASGQVSRVAARFALIGAAGELATAAGITGWATGDATVAAARCFKDWLSARGTSGSADEDRALRQVRLFFERYGEARFTPWTLGKGDICARCSGRGTVEYTYRQGECFDCHGKGTIGEEPIRPVYERAGFRRATDDGRTEFYVFPEVFRTDIAAGFDSTMVARLLGTHGFLRPDPAGRWQRSESLPRMGQKRVYVVTAAILSEGPASETAPHKHPESC
jgi:putative DNA primase/helicase